MAPVKTTKRPSRTLQAYRSTQRCKLFRRLTAIKDRLPSPDSRLDTGYFLAWGLRKPRIQRVRRGITTQVMVITISPVSSAVRGKKGSPCR